MFLVLLCNISLAAPGASARPDDGPMPANLQKTWVEIGGEVYGAKPDTVGPIGGGPGYTRVVSNGDYRVTRLDDLVEAVRKVQPGEVIFIEGEAEIDCTARVFADKFKLELPGDITLAGNRGHKGSRGAMIFSDAFATENLLEVLGDNVRITGLRVRGPDPRRRIRHHERSYNSARGSDKEQETYFYRLPVSTAIFTKQSGLEIDNCELSGWSHTAIYLKHGTNHHVHHNYIHHNQLHGLGYGVTHSRGVSLIEYNLFDYNRHSIAGKGHAISAYEARHNIELGTASGHNFDMHGRGSPPVAGKWIKIHHNTFRGTGVRAIGIRGAPVQGADVHNNWLYHEQPDEKSIRPWPVGGDTGVRLYNNAYGGETPRVLDP
jgi:hypothetical protein